jgi:uncharacterized membrane protein
VSEAAIALALPMILFTVDLRAWKRIAGPALRSMALAVLAVVVVAVGLWAVMRAQGVTSPHELAGLAVGVYTGGTPNLAAIKTALGVDDTRYLVFNAFDTVVGAAYLMFMVTLAPRLARRWLAPEARRSADAGEAVGSAHDEDYRELLTRSGATGVVKSLAVAAMVVGAAVVIGQAIGGADASALVISLLATFGVLASLAPPVRALAVSYKTGMYLIYVFSFTVASMARLDAMQGSDAVLFVFIVVAVFGSLALHLLLARFAKIDAGTFLVTSVSAICSPAFVPLVARSLADRTLLAAGIGTGIIGYAIGTQLGIGLALLLRQLA